MCSAGLFVAGLVAAVGGSGLGDRGFSFAKSPHDGEKWAKRAENRGSGIFVYLLQVIYLIGLGGCDGGWRAERHAAFSAG